MSGIDYSRFDTIDTSGSSDEEESEEEDSEWETDSDNGSSQAPAQQPQAGRSAPAGGGASRPGTSPNTGGGQRRPARPLFVDCPSSYTPLLLDKYWGLPSEFKPEEDEDNPGCIHQCAATPV